MPRVEPRRTSYVYSLKDVKKSAKTLIENYLHYGFLDLQLNFHIAQHFLLTSRLLSNQIFFVGVPPITFLLRMMKITVGLGTRRDAFDVDITEIARAGPKF